MKKKILGALLLLIGGAAIAAGTIYASGDAYYRAHFYNGSKLVLNSPDGSRAYTECDISDMTIEEIEEQVKEALVGYSMDIKEGDGSVEKLEAENVELRLSDEGKAALEDALAAQDHRLWFTHAADAQSAILEQKVTVEQSFSVDTAYDEEKMNNMIATMKCIEPDEVIEPSNAYLAYDDTTYRYVIYAGACGNQGNKEKITAKIKDVLESLGDEVVLDSTDYKQPEITTEDPDLIEKRDKVNHYLNAQITLKDGDKSYVIDGEEIITFIKIDEDYNVTFDTQAINRFIAYTLDPLFDTQGMERTITTVDSGTFTVSGGTWGKMVQTYKERPQLIKEISEGAVVERTPCYYEGYGELEGNGGIGNTYVDVNLTTQHVTYVVNGEVKIEMDCVTGKTSDGHDTPTGTYYIIRKKTEYTMVKYDAFVHFWLPIDDSVGVGLHDATWRSKFGGTIYKNSGSHGCINLPLEKTKELFNTVAIGTPVVVHK